MTRCHISIRSLSTGLAAIFLLASCGREEPVKVYEVIIPPAALAGTRAAAPSDSAAMGAAAAATAAPVRWTAPSDWDAQPLAPMINRGHFLLPGTTGSRPVLTISSFPGTVGGMAANLNRWRRQLGLPELPADELEKATESRKVGQSTLTVVHYEGKRPDGSPSAMTGAVLVLPAESWFFKLTGAPDAMAAQKPAFDAFLSTITTDDGPPPPTPASPAPPPPASTAPTSSPSPVAATDAPAAAKPIYQTPAGWKEMPASGMRAASFSIAGPDDMNADVSVVKLGGDGGGDLQNVNLWLQQLGLPAIDANALGDRLSSETLGPNPCRLFDASSTGKILQNAYRGRIIAAIITKDGVTWVARLRGEHHQLDQEKEKFRSFLTSLRLP